MNVWDFVGGFCLFLFFLCPLPPSLLVARAELSFSIFLCLVLFSKGRAEPGLDVNGSRLTCFRFSFFSSTLKNDRKYLLWASHVIQFFFLFCSPLSIEAADLLLLLLSSSE